MRNRPRLGGAPRLAVVFPAWPADFCPFGKAEGAERRVAPGTKHAWRGVPADVRVPLALGEGGRGALRRSARRWTACGVALPSDGAFPALTLVVDRQPVVTDHVGALCPRADPRAARAPCLQGTKAQAPHPAPLSDASGAPSSERGWWDHTSEKAKMVGIRLWIAQ